MCYDISLQPVKEIINEYFSEILIIKQLEFDFSFPQHFKAHSHDFLPIIIREDEALHLRNFEWGLIAHYMNSPEKVQKQRSWMCNARGEKVLDKNAYWYKIRQQRCLIPVVGIYEHRLVKGFKNKIPYHVRWRHRKMFCLPGFYNYSPIPDPETGELKGTFTIITTHANQLMSYIHNDGENKHRMPLFLPKELELEWLKKELKDHQLQEILNFQASSDDLECWTVSSIRSRTERSDGKQKHEPLIWPGLPKLGKDDQPGNLNLF